MCEPNPTDIALDESAKLWPSRPRRDVILSIGTGLPSGTFSPTETPTGYFANCMASRIARWSCSRLSNALNPQLTHERVQRNLHSHDQPSLHRYFRMNLDIPGPLPRMDDVTCMASLMTEVEQRRHDPIFHRIRLAMVASSFFFELERRPARIRGGYYMVHGALHIRGDPVRILELVRAIQPGPMRFTKDDEDLAVVESSERLCAKCGRFRVPVRFAVPNVNDPIALCLRLGSGPEHRISGFPQALRWFIDRQRLNDPFSMPDPAATGCGCPSRGKGRALSTRKRALPQRASGRIVKCRRVKG